MSVTLASGTVRFTGPEGIVQLKYSERESRDGTLLVETNDMKLDARALKEIATVLEKEELRLKRGRQLYSNLAIGLTLIDDEDDQ